MRYQVCFIDGYSNKYMVRYVDADCEKAARHRIYELYGDFEHEIITVKEAMEFAIEAATGLLDVQYNHLEKLQTEEQKAYYDGMKTAYENILLGNGYTIARDDRGKHSIVKRETIL